MEECSQCHVATDLKPGMEEPTHGMCWPCASSALEEVLEILAPFAFHAKALKVHERTDILTPISEVGVSGLCVGAFQSALEVFKKYHPGWGVEDGQPA